MKNKFVALPIIFTAVVLAACSNSAPECSAKETKQLVIKIAKDKLLTTPTKRKNYVLSLSAIRTSEFNESTGARACAAELDIHKITSDAKIKKINQASIKYTVELTDEGDQFFVNVFGL